MRRARTLASLGKAERNERAEGGASSVTETGGPKPVLKRCEN